MLDYSNPEEILCPTVLEIWPTFDNTDTHDAEFCALAHNLMPSLLEALDLLRRKMNPMTNDQATHTAALELLEKLK